MTATSSGLTLGKYAPLHRGHQRVIETGLREVDQMSVIIYDSPQVTDIPLPVRSGWLRALYPQVRLVEAWDGPAEVGYTPQLMRAHERYIIETLGISGITHFYSSEAYGEHLSVALGAVDRRVDARRRAVPVSATRVRGDPYRYRQFLDPLVYRDLIVNVVLMGAPGTGKTTLAGALARSFDTCWMPEYGREYWHENQLQRRLSPQQLVAIAEGHLAREEGLLAQCNRYLFTDTNAITTATFARYYHGRVHPRLDALADAAVSRYDLVLLCDTDLPFEDSWDRSGEVNREAFQRQVVADLNHRRVPFITVRGDLLARVSQVRGVLEGYRKYSNVLERRVDDA